ncbi:hypothetical protein AAHA92_06843 [Salvia divinorum]|uniref:Uncharacterized protein n=1 Tax=Salvia divinorum TaxID=28513 RepID=A0ABD1I709_SALDI
MEVRHHVAHGSETTAPEKDQGEQGQVEELLAQGSSALPLLPCDISLKCLDKLEVMNGNVICKFEVNHVEPILTIYIDPFLKSLRIAKHDMSFVNFNLDVRMIYLHAKTPRILFIGGFEF